MKRFFFQVAEKSLQLMGKSPCVLNSRHIDWDVTGKKQVCAWKAGDDKVAGWWKVSFHTHFEVFLELCSSFPGAGCNTGSRKSPLSTESLRARGVELGWLEKALKRGGHIGKENQQGGQPAR